MAQVTELGYIGFEVTALAVWENFAVGLLGLAPGVRDGARGLTLRMDERVHRLVLEQGPADDLAFIGLDCGSRAALDERVAVLRACGGALHVARAGLAFRHCQRWRRPPLPAHRGPRRHAGFLPAPRLSHQRLHAPGDSARHGGGRGLHPLQGAPSHPGLRRAAVTQAHPSLEVADALGVGRAHDRLQDARVPLALSLGAHPIDHMFSFYAVTPSGFCLERGAGGRLIEDDATWPVETYDRLSTWRHRPPAPASSVA